MRFYILFLAFFFYARAVAETPPASPAPTPQHIGLPKNKPMLGQRTLLCAAIIYTDDANPPYEGKAPGVCNQIRSFYLRNSRQMFDVKVKGVNHRVPFSNNRQWDKIKYSVKQKYPNYDYYALMVGTKLGASHAGAGTAFLRGALYRDAQHEFGHLIGLGHAGRYEWEKGKPVLHAYSDGESVMGRFPSDTLTGPQYRWLAWLPKEEVATYNDSMLGKEYEIKRITDTKLQMLSLVGIPVEYFYGHVPDQEAPMPHRDAFISFGTKCDQCLSLHLSMGGGSQKVAMFGNEYYDTWFSGIHVKVTESSKVKMKFTIDFEPKPSVKVSEVYSNNENEFPLIEGVAAMFQE